eukprot:4632168-Prymnesium_polylepis.1
MMKLAAVCEQQCHLVLVLLCEMLHEQKRWINPFSIQDSSSTSTLPGVWRWGASWRALSPEPQATTACLNRMCAENCAQRLEGQAKLNSCR